MTPSSHATDCVSDEEEQDILMDSHENDEASAIILVRRNALSRTIALSLFSLAIIASLGKLGSHNFNFVSKKSTGFVASPAAIVEESQAFSRSGRRVEKFRELALASGLEVLMVNDETIHAGDRLNFGSYGVFITQQHDGNLVIYKDNYPLWASGVVLDQGNFFTRLQKDGNLVTRNEAEEAVWSTDSHTDLEDDCFLAINLDDAQLEIIRGNEFTPGELLWESVNLPELIPPANNAPPLQELNKFVTVEYTLMPTDKILYVDDIVEYEGGYLMQQRNGAVVLMEYREDGRTVEIWTSGFTSDRDDAYWTIMQTDGNLVTHDSNGTPMWHSGSYQNVDEGGYYLVLYPTRLAIVHGSTSNPDEVVWEESIERNTLVPISSPVPSQAPQVNGPIILLRKDERLDESKAISFEDGFLIQERNGNLALVNQGNEVWTSSISREEGNYTTTLQGDGNLLTMDADNNVVWASDSHSDIHTDYFLCLTSNKDELEVFRGTPENPFAKVWSSIDGPITRPPPPYNNPVTNANFSMTNSDHTVGVYYYPWYGNTDFNGRNYAREKIIPQQLPLLGEYDQRDPEVISEHLRMSRMANVNLWVTSWWGPGSATDRNTKAILENRDLPGMKIALFYETSGTIPNGYTGEVSSHLEYAADNYFGSEHYLKINGRPVFFVYLARVLSQTGRLEAAVNEMRRGARARGYEIYIVGDSAFYKPPRGNYQAFELLDAVTNYDVYGSLGRPEYAGQQLIDQERDRQEGWRQAAHKQGCHFIPAAEPGYNDNGVRNNNHQPMSRKLCRNCGFGSLFRELVQNAVEQCDFETGNMLMVTSFNEWHEDTQIEPVQGQGTTVNPNQITWDVELQAYGTQYLDILREVTDRPSTTTARHRHS
eukprot:CAMPEP_0195282806 /NCGR_PEP_ID=MMETSP0707-20130614/1557_1 /TAXON_ID=33640 /ORGANISM="Asterionellopsis glacialis, Strain CCMP134" /LENGTH=879 /DNA_ID=CAMNT_0040341857 /DNA_START=14 /DNA_END=2653 /DNA_ORIENTATION=+